MRIILTFLCLSVAAVFGQSQPQWVLRSNTNAQLLIDLDAQYSPEGATSDGVTGLDEAITTPSEARDRARRNDTLKVVEELQNRQMEEKDPAVKQDLEILIGAASRRVSALETYQKYFLPYGNPGSLVFFGVRTLLGDQVSPERHAAALVRLTKYTGGVAGATPLTKLYEARYRAKLNVTGLLPPDRKSVV